MRGVFAALSNRMISNRAVYARAAPPDVTDDNEVAGQKIGPPRHEYL